jgi:hypothetical protein
LPFLQPEIIFLLGDTFLPHLPEAYRGNASRPTALSTLPVTVKVPSCLFLVVQPRALLHPMQPINGDCRGDDRCIVLFGGGCSRYV